MKTSGVLSEHTTGSIGVSLGIFMVSGGGGPSGLFGYSWILSRVSLMVPGELYKAS